jgi:hypothetical protein
MYPRPLLAHVSTRVQIRPCSLVGGESNNLILPVRSADVPRRVSSRNPWRLAQCVRNRAKPVVENLSCYGLGILWKTATMTWLRCGTAAESCALIRNIARLKADPCDEAYSKSQYSMRAILNPCRDTSSESVRGVKQKVCSGLTGGSLESRVRTRAIFANE